MILRIFKFTEKLIELNHFLSELKNENRIFLQNIRLKILIKRYNETLKF